MKHIIGFTLWSIGMFGLIMVLGGFTSYVALITFVKDNLAVSGVIAVVIITLIAKLSKSKD
jgi:multisubunit Na+/H+ antiporter MnhC subunit